MKNSYKRNSHTGICKIGLILTLFVFTISSLEASESSGHDEKIDAMHHIMDAYTLDFLPFFEIHLPRFAPIHVGGFEIDLSITRHVVMMWVATLILIILFISVSRAYKQSTSTTAPKGLQNAIEVVVEFVINDIAKPNIPHGYQRFLPYLLTVFFFILSCNLLGLIPFAATATGNIAVTMTLAIFSFLIIQYAGLRANGVGGYLAHLTGGTPWFLWPIMVPVEVIGLFIKPFALTMRLFANMIAGHIVIVTLLGLTFLYQSYVVGVLSVTVTLGVYLLEIFVSFMQAFIFTMLTSVFIGMATEHSH
ncbi:MAG: F0F1 ATP synthase subunit A [Chloroherpetonaceae bacterium]|nr:F0F1 ATP synthase subunit A [Chloroherpetonaceae bacterium]